MSDINNLVLQQLHNLIQKLYYDFEDMKWNAVAFEEYLNDNGIVFVENGTQLSEFFIDISHYTPASLYKMVEKRDDGPFGIYYIVKKEVKNRLLMSGLIIPEDIILLFK